MTRAEEVAAAWAAVDTETNDMATRVQALIDEINRTATEGLNGPQTEAVLANLTGLVTRLSATGRNPTQPIPPPVPPVPMPGPFN
jgi:hypothetical protein